MAGYSCYRQTMTGGITNKRDHKLQLADFAQSCHLHTDRCWEIVKEVQALEFIGMPGSDCPAATVAGVCPGGRNWSQQGTGGREGLWSQQANAVAASQLIPRVNPGGRGGGGLWLCTARRRSDREICAAARSMQAQPHISGLSGRNVLQQHKLEHGLHVGVGGLWTAAMQDACVSSQ